MRKKAYDLMNHAYGHVSIVNLLIMKMKALLSLFSWSHAGFDLLTSKEPQDLTTKSQNSEDRLQVVLSVSKIILKCCDLNTIPGILSLILIWNWRINRLILDYFRPILDQFRLIWFFLTSI